MTLLDPFFFRVSFLILFQFHFPDPELDVFQDFAVGGDGICQDTEHHSEDADHDQQAAQDEGLHVPLPVPHCPDDKIADPEQDAGKEGDAADSGEKAQGLVHDVGPDDREHGFLDIAEHAAEQPRRAQLGICPDRNGEDGHPVPSGLDDLFQRVGVLVDHVEAERGLPAVGPEPAGCIGDAGAGRLPDHPAPQVLELFLQGGGRNVPWRQSAWRR